MTAPIILIGIGEIGGIFAKGLLRSGHPVIPVTRKMDMTTVANDHPAPQLVLIAVAETDIQDVLTGIPTPWRDRLGLLQNEILPHDWESQSIQNPTVISVWFEKKKGQDVKILLPSAIYGPHGELVKTALDAIDIPSFIADDNEQLLFELVLKNVYILTINIAGLITHGTVTDLWKNHRKLTFQVANDVIKLQAKLVNKELPKEKLIAGMVEAFKADPEHKCMGRSAPARLIRAMVQAEQADLDLPALREIQNKL